MIHIFLLIWFLVTPDNGNTIVTKQFDSRETCEAEGAYLDEVSKAAVTAKKATTYGGECYEVINSNNGST